MHDKVDLREPYRLFFPLGLFMAIAGTAPWILFQSGLLDMYPSVFHARVMFHGFLMAFISGFLMTAVPRMSGTEPCRPLEAAMVMILLSAQLILGTDPTLSALIFMSHSAALLIFVGRRVLKRSQNPPSIFLFVPVGLATAFAGGLLLALSPRIPPAWAELGRLWAFQAFVLNLIVGLGSRLIPVLSRAPGALSPTQGGGAGWRVHLPMLILFNLSFPLEAFVDIRGGVALRALTLTWAALDGLRLMAPLQPVTALGIALRVSTVFLFVPYYLMMFFPAGRVHWLHLTYIGGLGLMTIMVAVRVVLAHGGAGFDKEVRSPGLIAATAALLIATLVRTLLPLWDPSVSFQAFSLAGALWIIGTALWWMTLGRHIRSPFAVFRRSPR